ncbi:MAG: hypothetical protein ACYS0E_02025 [Planctomycetota bacterium]|jgi:hypothetical protein
MASARSCRVRSGEIDVRGLQALNLLLAFLHLGIGAEQEGHQQPH